MEKIYNIIKAEYPDIKTIVWNTDLINNFTLHYVMTKYIIVETEKVAIDLVVNLLKEKLLKKYTIVTEEILVKNQQLYINSEQLLIVKALHVKSPLINNREITIEKMMLDLYKDELYIFVQGRELETIYENIFSKYEVNMKKLLSYAKYRVDINDFKKFINKINIPEKYKARER